MAKNFIQNPTKKSLIIFGILIFIGAALLIVAMTDLFKKSLFGGQNILLLIMILYNLALYGRMFYNYFKNKKHQSQI